MIDLIVDYEKYVDSLPKLIKESKYKTEHFIKVLGIGTATFYRKIKTKAFTIKEVKIISKELYPEEYYQMQFMKTLKESITEAGEGKVKSNQEVLEEMHRRIQKLVN